MKIGVVFPQTEIEADPGAIREYAQVAEEIGYHHILVYDHVLGANPDRPGGWRGPYTYENPFLSPFLLYSYMAAITTRLHFVTGILILPQRETALVAKQAATLDVLSNGRFRLGVGVGWNAVEYEALNQDFHTRGKRIEEQIDVIRRLWAEPLVTFEGRWHNIPDAGLNPRPVQQPIPIWMGSHADAVLRRIARLGDGWFPGYRTPEAAGEALEKLREYTAAEGREWRELGIEPRLHYRYGTPASWSELARAWEAAGATHLSVNTMGAGLTDAAAHITAIREVAAVLFN